MNERQCLGGVRQCLADCIGRAEDEIARIHRMLRPFARNGAIDRVHGAGYRGFRKNFCMTDSITIHYPLTFRLGRRFAVA